VLYYGVSDLFLPEIEELGLGLVLDSLSNNLNTPGDLEADKFHLAKSIDIARGKKQAILSQLRYGGKALIIRIRAVPDVKLLSPVVEDDELVSYEGTIPFEGYLEVFEVGEVEFTKPPLFPNAIGG
jgi:hypothetical protein